MNVKHILILWASILFVLFPIFAQTDHGAASQKSAGPAASAPAGSEARGQKVFQQNCARCHNAPQVFPPQISATILRHMRVRASLSARDERDLLRFMNP